MESTDFPEGSTDGASVERGMDLVAEADEVIGTIIDDFESDQDVIDAVAEYERVTAAMVKAAAAGDCDETEVQRLNRVEAVHSVLALRDHVLDILRSEYETLRELTDDMPQPVPRARIDLLSDITEFRDGGTTFVLQLAEDSGNTFDVCPDWGSP